MQQASFKCETPRLELKSWRTFLAIKRCQRTKIRKVIKLARSSKKSAATEIQRESTQKTTPIRLYSKMRFYGQSKSSASEASPPESTSAGDDEVPTRRSGGVFTSRIGLGNWIRRSHRDGQGEGEEVGGGLECTSYMRWRTTKANSSES